MSVARGITYHDRTGQPRRNQLTMQQPEPAQWLNPNVGWVIGPIAMATAWVEAQMPKIDLSWAELLYSIAAVLYATAAVIKTLKEKKQLPADQTLSSNGQHESATKLKASPEDTIDCK